MVHDIYPIYQGCQAYGHQAGPGLWEPQRDWKFRGGPAVKFQGIEPVRVAAGEQQLH